MYIRYILLLLLLSSSFQTLQACDACGCSIMFWDLGITPRFQSHQISLGWQQQSFTSYSSAESLALGVIGSEERFHQLDLQTQWRLHDRWRLHVALPYSALRRTVDKEEWRQNGWGDPSVLLQYVVLDQDEKSTISWRHRLSAGLGIKLPFGQQPDLSAEEIAQANFRLGTGSTDALVYLQYVIRHGSWGLSVDGLLSRNGTNDEDYRYGHRRSGHLNVFAVWATGKVGIMPSMGIYYEGAQADVQRTFYRNQTGGHYTFGQVGVQLFWPAFSASFQYQRPIEQEWADGLTSANERWMARVSYFL